MIYCLYFLQGPDPQKTLFDFFDCSSVPDGMDECTDSTFSTTQDTPAVKCGEPSIRQEMKSYSLTVIKPCDGEEEEEENSTWMLNLSEAELLQFESDEEEEEEEEEG